MLSLRSPYLRLMRLHQPVGILLLLWPCWWSIAMTSPTKPSFILLFLFAAGAIAMRSAGCIINDIADREFDRQVERTRQRPLASGELSLSQAFALLVVLLFLSLLIALLLGRATLLWAIAALPLVALYPLMKRISWWPQLFLGLTFNWGALLGGVAVTGSPVIPALWLYAGGICWTLGYDTIYALQDRADDVAAGVKSSALRLGSYVKPAVGLFYLCAVLCWAMAGWAAHMSMLFYACLALVQLHFSWQYCQLAPENPANARRLFLSNGSAGFLLFIACMLGHI